MTNANPIPTPVVQGDDPPDLYAAAIAAAHDPRPGVESPQGPNGRDADLPSEGDVIITDEQREALEAVGDDKPSLSSIKALLPTFPAPARDTAPNDPSDEGAPPAPEDKE